jgi:cell division protein ZapE
MRYRQNFAYPGKASLMDSTLPKTPLGIYRTELASGTIQPDSSQLSAVEQLESLYQILLFPSKKPSFVARFLAGSKRLEPVRGLYFWGGVGRGKTYLMDSFYQCLPFESKSRMHFHRFMRMVHNELARLQGRREPLQVLADDLAGKMRLLCFDEFFISDIADAMILGGLLDALFERGVTLVATSNVSPEQLYENGLQRRKFLPAIELLKQHTLVINLDGGVDYRLRALEMAEIYHSPLDQQADVALERIFHRIAPEQGQIGQVVEVAGRIIRTRYLADGVVWLEFREICAGPRSQNDYIELARLFQSVLISNVPLMAGNEDDLARRFINLVDEFYDRNVKIILSAAGPVESLYRGRQLLNEFERTKSRLVEMQSLEYLSREHKP